MSPRLSAQRFEVQPALGHCLLVRRLVADFYEVPRHRLGELRDAAKGSWTRIGRNREHWKATLAGLGRPIPRYESPDDYFAAVLGVVGDTPLPGGQAMLGYDTPAFADLLMELVESRGGGWDLIEPSPERIAALDPATFDPERLRADYATAERCPADAGERLLRDIALLRSALTGIGEDSVLLIHTWSR